MLLVIGYDAIAIDYPFQKGMLDELTELAAGVLTSRKSTFIYVMDSLSGMSSQVRNIQAVMITAMYNAPATMDSYYTTKVNHDMKTA